jgi:integrase
MRRGEVLGLKRDDINQQHGRLSVTQSIVLVDGHPIVSEPKTAKGRRSISLDRDTLAGLRGHLRQQSEERLAWGLPTKTPACCSLERTVQGYTRRPSLIDSK